MLKKLVKATQNFSVDSLSEVFSSLVRKQSEGQFFSVHCTGSS